MGLDTLDEFSPRDTDPVSLGDDAIRATRAATKQTVGVEHYLDGPHKIPQGTQAVRPAAGRAGRLYYDTDAKDLEYDNGSSWAGVSQQVAQATILYRTAQSAFVSGQLNVEFPFDTVLDDPGKFANLQYHQIVMPANAICLVSLYLSWAGPFGGGFGVISQIEQYEVALSLWRPLVQEYVGPLVQYHYTSLTAMADSRWGQNLRVTISNGSTANMYVDFTSLGASPRFSMAVMGRTS